MCEVIEEAHVELDPVLDEWPMSPSPKSDTASSASSVLGGSSAEEEPESPQSSTCGLHVLEGQRKLPDVLKEQKLAADSCEPEVTVLMCMKKEASLVRGSVTQLTRSYQPSDCAVSTWYVAANINKVTFILGTVELQSCTVVSGKCRLTAKSSPSEARNCFYTWSFGKPVSFEAPRLFRGSVHNKPFKCPLSYIGASLSASPYFCCFSDV